MKIILFVMRATSHLHYHKSVIEALQKKGHRVELLYDPRYSDAVSIEKAKNFCHLTGCKLYPAVVPRGLAYAFLRHTRDLLSWRRYLTNKYIAHLIPFRQDWKGHLPFLDKVFLKMPGGNRLLITNWFARVLAWFEEVLPADSSIVNDIQTRRPDAVIVSPVNMRNSSAELDYFKAAHGLHVPVAVQVISWDNLTVRGLFHIRPDRIICWNNSQAAEARSHHHVPQEAIRIVGAAAFDAWFAHSGHTTPREEFCERYGLRPEYPIVTYLGSARNIAKDETAVLRQLRNTFNASPDPRLARLQIALRVHPGNFKAYIDFSVPGCIEVPPRGSIPDTEEALQLFHDTLAHSVAVIQINTSGAIDAIIDGKPCISLVYPEFASQQIDTIHFKQLMESGATDLPVSPEECAASVIRLLDGDDKRKEARHKFIADFIRPRGVETSAGEHAAKEIEDMVAALPKPAL